MLEATSEFDSEAIDADGWPVAFEEGDNGINWTIDF